MADYIDRYIPQSYLFGALGMPIDGACGKCHQTKTDCMCQSLSRMDICGIIEDAPSADVRENVHGHWADDDKCSVCGEEPLYEYDLRTLNFCPNCGADMRGTEE